MIPSGERRSFLLSITLTELALLMFFLLLLLAGKRVHELLAANAQMSEEQQTLHSQVLERFSPSDTAEIANLLAQCAEADFLPVRASQLRFEVDSIDAVLDSVRTTLAESADSLNLLRDALEDERRDLEGTSALVAMLNENGDAAEEFRELVRVAASNEGLRLENERLREENVARDSMLAAERAELAALQSASLVDSLAALTEARRSEASCQGQLAFLSKRCEPGFGIPPCWTDSNGSIEYIFTVAFNDSLFSVSANWPEYREIQGDLDRIPGVRALLESDLTELEFRNRALPILEWSRNQEPECRHYVVINDARDMSKTAFKRNLLTVEDFFYKYLPGR